LPVDSPAPEPPVALETAEHAPEGTEGGTYAYTYTGSETVTLTSPHRGEVAPGETYTSGYPVHHAHFEPVNDAARQARALQLIAAALGVPQATEPEGEQPTTEPEPPARSRKRGQ
jgi:hypothetical protein